jgi:hypothetical protein
MPAFRQRTRLIYALLGVCLLVLGQNVAALHAGENDDGASRSATCAACVVVNLLSSACLDTGGVQDSAPLLSGVVAAHHRPFPSVEIRSPRQRGPPLI